MYIIYLLLSAQPAAKRLFATAPPSLSDGTGSTVYTEMALIFWVTGVRHTGQRLNFAAHVKQQQWCPHGTSVQSTAESKHTWT